jgi:hypothetical protein
MEMDFDLEEIILYLNANEPTGKYCKNIENLKNKLLKAQEDEKILSIIKEKNVDLGMVDFFDNVEDYNEWLTLQPNESRKPLSEYEFELIKQ